MTDRLEQAVRAITRGELVVYPTETVYGLGADALDPDAIERVFAAKDRPRTDPISLAVPSLAAADAYVTTSDREQLFMRAFLPGPITVVVERNPKVVPESLTGGRSRVGLRVPDHPIAQAFLARVSPVTATSANVSGEPSVRQVVDLDAPIRDAASIVLDGGETPGGGSTVVDVSADSIIRRGAMADEVAEWLAANPA